MQLFYNKQVSNNFKSQSKKYFTTYKCGVFSVFSLKQCVLGISASISSSDSSLLHYYHVWGFTGAFILGGFLQLLTVGGRHTQEAETYKEWNAADGFLLLRVSLLNDGLLGDAVCTEKLTNSVYPSVLGCVHTAEMNLFCPQVKLGCPAHRIALLSWTGSAESSTGSKVCQALGRFTTGHPSSESTSVKQVLKFRWLRGDLRMGLKLSTCFAE